MWARARAGGGNGEGARVSAEGGQGQGARVRVQCAETHHAFSHPFFGRSRCRTATRAAKWTSSSCAARVPLKRAHPVRANPLRPRIMGRPSQWPLTVAFDNSIGLQTMTASGS